MPKRSCPFGDGDSCIPQQKIHVGEKQVDSGIMSHKKMKAVYDKTLNLLYRGAKNIMNNNTETMDVSPIIHKDTKTNLHQMVLTSYGTLAKPCQAVETNVAKQSLNSNLCTCCKMPVTIIRPPCAYCECSLCHKCIRSCFLCKGEFCTKCSIIVYLQEERFVCLSCC